MKQKTLHSIFSFFMAFVVLFSTLSFTVKSHYCGNRLVDSAIFTKVKTCGMEASAKIPMKKGCCNEEIVVVKGQDELKLNSFENLNFKYQLVLSAFVYTYNTLFVSLPKQIITHKNYIPPNLIVDIQLLDAVFLI